MSGMGGLNLLAQLLISRAKQLAAILDICLLVWVNSVKQICESKQFALYNQLVSSSL
jgi:hypothetical protein